MLFAIERGRIEGLFLVQPKIFRDSRGCFLETWNEKDFNAAGFTMRFVQDNQSISSKGVLRGLHYQKRNPQGKMIRAICGEIFDTVVDLREQSPTFGQWQGFVLSGTSQNQLYVPPGFANGFFVLSDEARVAYKCTDFYNPGDESGIRWDDPIIGIDWPLAGIEPTLSAKDSALPLFDPKGGYFRLDGSPL